MIEDIWGKKPSTKYDVVPYEYSNEFYDIEEMDAWLEKLKEYYAPYDALLKAEPFMPMDIRSVLGKEGMPILIDEGWFNELKEKAKLVDALEDEITRRQEDTRMVLKLEKQLEAVKMWKYGMFVRMPFIGNQGHISRSDLDDLEKILEAEE